MEIVENDLLPDTIQRPPIFLNTARLETKNSLFKNCQVSQIGGAIYAYSESIYNDTGSVFTQNLAYNGGALCLSQTEATLSNTTFVNNYGINGGAVYVDASSKVNFIKTMNFTSNYGMTSGGALYISSFAQFTIDDSTFDNNEGNDGGAIYVLSVDKGCIIQNSLLK
jgi:hypothetical protein